MSMAANLADHVQDNGDARTAYQKFMQEMATNQRTVEDLCQQFQRRQALLMSQTTNAREKNRQIRETDRSGQNYKNLMLSQQQLDDEDEEYSLYKNQMHSQKQLDDEDEGCSLRGKSRLGF